jgi:threonyl-tRNA synthetase
VNGTAWETTPLQIARDLSKSLAERIIIAKVNNQELWDLNRPLEQSCTVALLDFDSPQNNFEARQVFWHSSAHVLGEACERSFEGCCLGYGPPLEEGGFFYDMSLADQKTVTLDDYPGIEEVCKKTVNEKQPFERLMLPKTVLLEMFKVFASLIPACCGANLNSTINTSSTTSTTRFRMEPALLSTDVVP